VRQLCDVALWLDGGRQQACGPTDRVLASYEAHVREQNRRTHTDTEATADAAPRETPQTPVVLGAERRGAIVSVDVADLGIGEPPLLRGPHLSVTVIARLAEGEEPNVGVMLEQAQGVGITVAVTHEDGAKMTRGADGLWRITVTFTELSLHSGEYVLSAYLLDSKGLVVYDEWMHCRSFAWEYPRPVPGLLQLPHEWS
jgi:lipopolysaccharide transport system ATP-binding protein